MLGTGPLPGGARPSSAAYVCTSRIGSAVSGSTGLCDALLDYAADRQALILCSYRPKQMLDLCAKSLIYEGGKLAIETDLEQRSERFPIRWARENAWRDHQCRS